MSMWVGCYFRGCRCGGDGGRRRRRFIICDNNNLKMSVTPIF